MDFSNAYEIAYNTFNLNTSSVIRSHYESDDRFEPTLTFVGGKKPELESISLKNFPLKPGIEAYLECNQRTLNALHAKDLWFIDKNQLPFSDTEQVTVWKCKGLILDNGPEVVKTFPSHRWNYKVIEVVNEKGVSSLFKEIIGPGCTRTRCSSDLGLEEQVYYSDKANFPGIDAAMNQKVPCIASFASLYKSYIPDPETVCSLAFVAFAAMSLAGSICFDKLNESSFNKINEKTADKPDNNKVPLLSTAQKAQYAALVYLPFALSVASLLASSYFSQLDS